MINKEALEFNSFSEACAAFKLTDPYIFINYDHKGSDIETARQVAMDLIKQGLNVFFDEVSILTGQDHDFEIIEATQECSHMIDIVSANRGEGKHIKHMKEALSRSGELTMGRTHLFPLAETDEVRNEYIAQHGQKINVGTWKSESNKIDFVVSMMIVGPKGRGYVTEEVPTQPADRLIIKDGVDSPPSECPGCGAPIESHYSDKCSYCSRGVTHYEKLQNGVKKQEVPYEPPYRGKKSEAGGGEDRKGIRNSIKKIFGL